MRVVWTDRARQRLKELKDYIAKDSATAARRVVRRLILKSRQLESAPRLGRPVPEYQRDDVRELLVRPYRIIYRLRSARIDILTVRHYRQLFPSDLAKI
jgi:toxin ParE1/3/4